MITFPKVVRLSIHLMGTFLLLLTGCSPSSLEDFQHEGEAHCRRLVIELQKIQNSEQLLRSETRLRKHFESLVDRMIEAREYQQKHPEDVLPETFAHPASDMLKEELKRIYGIEGGREVIERSQHEALVRLDAFERALAKQKEIAR